MYAVDLFPHEEGDPQGLYSGIPYIQGHTDTQDAGLMMLSASETWADLVGYTDRKGRLVNFIAESGSLEMYMFGSKRRPKELSRKMAKVTGYQAMPPMYAVGFHYSKWERETSTN